MKIEKIIGASIIEAFKVLYNKEIEDSQIKIEKTKKEFEGDYTFNVFPFLKLSGKSPEITAGDLGQFLIKELDSLDNFNVIKGFLNLSVKTDWWIQYFNQNIIWNENFGQSNLGLGKKIMVEYSSPNTNKPLHLGHVRNNLLGFSLSEILKYNSYQVIKSNLINDRGIHICKSMLAWQRFGNNETPENSGIKGDHLVGKYYVEFEKALQNEYNTLAGIINSGDLSSISEADQEKLKSLIKQKQELPEEKLTKINDDLKELIRNNTPIMKEVKKMLIDWEAGKPEVIELWKTMNSWVYEGFNKTYARLGVSFDQFYYESNTYLLGKEIVEEGLNKGVFFKKEDGSVWIDLTDIGLDQKLVLRRDGTSVYITQDIGTADLKYQQYQIDQSVYVVGNEQDYHFKVLFEIIKRLGRSYSDGLYHLSYGMVDLPSGKMKSREGTVVDADDLMNEMYQTAKSITEELGKTEGFTEEQLHDLYESIGIGALKYYLLKVDPSKRLLFNPAESIDFQGNTGPFIQYTHARIKSLLKNLIQAGFIESIELPEQIEIVEKEVIKELYRFPDAVLEAGKNYSPAVIANYVYELVKVYNRFYQELSINKESDSIKKSFRYLLSVACADVIKKSLNMLGMQAPEKM